jgi:hypothetical protein
MIESMPIMEANQEDEVDDLNIMPSETVEPDRLIDDNELTLINDNQNQFRSDGDIISKTARISRIGNDEGEVTLDTEQEFMSKMNEVFPDYTNLSLPAIDEDE